VKLAVLLSIKKWRSSAELNKYIAHLPQQCHNPKFVIFQEKLLKVLKCYNFLSATTTQLLSSGEICKLRYDTIPVKSASANVSLYTNNSKMPNFDL
jgi:hypothetical protein